MLACPSGHGTEDAAAEEGKPAKASWQDAGSVEHAFTHFSLTLRLRCARATVRPEEGIWWPIDRLEQAGLPTVFSKLIPRGRAWREAVLPATQNS